jgi:quercetin dioxygenase-like cupin family protein
MSANVNKRRVGAAIVLSTLLYSASISGNGYAQTADTQAEPRITVTSPAAQRASEGAATTFTGSVHIQALFGVQEPSHNTGGLVTFQPGARSAWHTHPLGQVLIITDGEGWIQEWGKPRQTMHKGDVVQIPAGVKHWHGATATSSVTHIAIQEMSEGRNVDWLEKVSDAQYNPAH